MSLGHDELSQQTIICIFMFDRVFVIFLFQKQTLERLLKKQDSKGKLSKVS